MEGEEFVFLAGETMCRSLKCRLPLWLVSVRGGHEGETETQRQALTDRVVAVPQCGLCPEDSAKPVKSFKQENDKNHLHLSEITQATVWEVRESQNRKPGDQQGGFRMICAKEKSGPGPQTEATWVLILLCHLIALGLNANYST